MGLKCLGGGEGTWLTGVELGMKTSTSKCLQSRPTVKAERSSEGLSWASWPFRGFCVCSVFTLSSNTAGTEGEGHGEGGGTRGGGGGG